MGALGLKSRNAAKPRGGPCMEWGNLQEPSHSTSPFCCFLFIYFALALISSECHSSTPLTISYFNEFIYYIQQIRQTDRLALSSSSKFLRELDQFPWIKHSYDPAVTSRTRVHGTNKVAMCPSLRERGRCGKME